MVPQPRTPPRWLAIVLALSLVAAAALPAAATTRTDATRSVDPGSAEPGDRVTIQVQIDVSEDVDHLTVEDTHRPDASNVTIESTDVPEESSVVVGIETEDGVTVAIENVPAGSTVTVTYSMIVPDDTSEDALAFNGTVMTDGEDHDIGGDSSVSVQTSTSTPTATATPSPTPTATPTPTETTTDDSGPTAGATTDATTTSTTTGTPEQVDGGGGGIPVLPVPAVLVVFGVLVLLGFRAARR